MITGDNKAVDVSTKNPANSMGRTCQYGGADMKRLSVEVFQMKGGAYGDKEMCVHCMLVS